MLNQFSRTQLLLGEEAMDILKNARVIIFGIGGVGGFAAEALARSGVGTIDLVDDDKVCLTNLNRQIIATRKTVGKYKAEVMEERIHEINPSCTVNVHKTFYLPENSAEFHFADYDYVIDAVDTMTAKIQLVMARRREPRSSAAWAQGISWIRRSFRSQIFIKRPLIHLHVSCGVN